MKSPLPSGSLFLREIPDLFWAIRANPLKTGLSVDGRADLPSEKRRGKETENGLVADSL